MENNAISKYEEEIRKRLKENNIETENTIIMFQRNQTYLNCEQISGYSQSSDKRWMCVPVSDEEVNAFIDGYHYKPQCFEVVGEFQTYLSDDTFSILTNVWLLRRP